ncbi:MAG: hypothetical protein J5611_01200, partial [Alphaproteobacteria bacterium]|nr:hypothetical protein [Alphaproteobacteria bacterium]
MFCTLLPQLFAQLSAQSDADEFELLNTQRETAKRTAIPTVFSHTAFPVRHASHGIGNFYFLAAILIGAG